MQTLRQAALSVAQTQIGQKENPINSNWGHPVQDYLASVGIFFPASWCMSFMYWCFNHAAGQLGTPNPMTKTGGVLAQYNSKRITNGVSIDKTEPLNKSLQPGDIFIMDEGKGLGHTGIVESIDADGTIHTIEGNTNLDGSRNGFEVERKTRHNVAPIIGFLRF
jgi:CHAP domain